MSENQRPNSKTTHSLSKTSHQNGESGWAASPDNNRDAR
jgi:hypothetical protein